VDWNDLVELGGVAREVHMHTVGSERNDACVCPALLRRVRVEHLDLLARLERAASHICRTRATMSDDAG
jgi:hypothetical protein